MSVGLDNIQEYEKRLAALDDQDEEALLKLVADYELLLSTVQSDGSPQNKATVFSHSHYERLLSFNNVLVNRLKEIKDIKYQSLKKIKLGKEMQLSYHAC